MIHAYRAQGAVVHRNISSAVAAATMTMEVVPASSERILVIEDDRAVQKALKRLFEGEGFAVDVAGNGAAGLDMFRAAMPSVLVLDLSLPGTPGQDVCREISQAAPSLPIIILSARTEVMDKVLLLELGAHDYVTKPFSPRELLARVRTAMRRSTPCRSFVFWKSARARNRASVWSTPAPARSTASRGICRWMNGTLSGRWISTASISTPPRPIIFSGAIWAGSTPGCSA